MVPPAMSASPHDDAISAATATITDAPCLEAITHSIMQVTELDEVQPEPHAKLQLIRVT
jgi:hypothetical protein